jgi:hypothetical protein
VVKNKQKSLERRDGEIWGKAGGRKGSGMHACIEGKDKVDGERARWNCTVI